MSSELLNKINDARYPNVRNDMRGNRNIFYWTPTEYPFYLSSHKEENVRRKRKKKKKDPYYQAKAEIWAQGINKLHFQQSMSNILQIEAQDIITHQFTDEKDNHWFIALNSNTFDTTTLNHRLKLSFVDNKKKQSHERGFAKGSLWFGMLFTPEQFPMEYNNGPGRQNSQIN